MTSKAMFAATALAIAVGAPAAHAQATIDEAIEGLYEVISGAVGEARDWDRFRAMYLPGAQMTVVVPDAEAEGGERLVILSIEDYIERSGPRLVEMGFVETETRRQTHQLGGLATVLSAYEGVRTDTGETIAVGVNTIVLARQEGAWKIASLAWRPSSEDWPVERAFEAQ